MSLRHASSSRSQSKARGESGAEHSEQSSHLRSFENRRGFMGSQSGLPLHVGALGGSHANNSLMSEEGVAVCIQGTALDIGELRAAVRDFLTAFRPNGGAAMSPYMAALQQIRETEEYSLTVSAEHVYQFDAELYYKLVCYPPEVISVFDRVASETFRDNFGERNASDRGLLTTFVALRRVSALREIDFKEINRLICVRGLVVRVSEVLPEMRVPVFRCAGCGHRLSEGVERGRVREPAQCPKCFGRHCFELLHNHCLFADKQLVRLQEAREEMPEGGLPAHANLVLYDELVDACKPGDVVEVVGIFRALPVRLNRHQSVLRALFRSYLDVVSLTPLAVGDVPCKDGVGRVAFSEEESARHRAFAREPDLCARLSQALAPTVLGMEDVKRGLLCQLFGGAEKHFDPAFRPHFRNELNVLLVGDPSTAKSQLLQAMHAAAPRGIFTSGKGSSAVGLTAAVTSDPETRELVLESGALVLSDGGVCCIDEFDKLDEGAVGVLHEAMEQQTISIAKAGIVCSLNARTAVLAAANPRESRYNPKRSIVYNLRLPPALLSRFDLIYLLLDRAGEAADARLAAHVLALFAPGGAAAARSPLSLRALRRYVAFARTHCRPRLSEAAARAAAAAYVELRRAGNSRNTVTATPRQLESVVRIAEALARMRLADEVALGDVREAVRLVRVATQAAAVDPATGQIDMNLIATGYASGLRARLALVLAELRSKLVAQEELFRRGYSGVELCRELRSALRGRAEIAEEISGEEIAEALRVLEEERKINVVGDARQEHFQVKLLRIER